ncbi:nucleotide sugar dehydrogenase [Halorubellus sp. JP-L1]|uniref:nucleotide sugar dehydrogenase n=1 Tax=Halorubellus sp. JP-L1 TaxID=2715753 RepID=UPI00140A094F|nr:nucleotide sugar dehydrogenase [Halorubellus sp. JP-L1]NHN40920.1 nucleotide sugar dehydrogenase [Halorubellus sp. JP-L1]
MTTGSLHEAIADRSATVGVLGLGYVGLPLSLAFVDAGFAVRGFDVDQYRVRELQAGLSYVDDVTDEELQRGLESGFEPSDDPSVLADCDAYVLAVPTGMDDAPDMSAIEAASRTVAEQSGPGETLVVVSSTVYPGATREVVAPIVDDARDAPTRFAMVPERLNPGGEYAFGDIPLVVGADSDRSRAIAEALFDAVVSETYPVSSTQTAELTKTLENTYRMVNIGLVNELVSLVEGMDADLWEAIDAAATKPFGFQPFRPGPGVGGHCTPIDPQFLAWRARRDGTELSLVEGAQTVNDDMPALVAERVERLLRARGVDPADASVLALGASYKPDVGDVRNSPALDVLSALPEEAAVVVADPYVDASDVPRELVRDVTPADSERADVVVLLVDHAAFDLHAIGDAADVVFDARNAMPDDVAADVVALGDLGDDPTADSRGEGLLLEGE